MHDSEPFLLLPKSHLPAVPGAYTCHSASKLKYSVRILPVCLGLLCILRLILPTLAFAQNVTTQQYGNARTGLQDKETILTPANVNSSSFGKLFTLPVSGHVYAQPLYMGGLTMPDGTTHNVLFVATEQDLVYAFDADGNNPGQGYLWKKSLLNPGETWKSYVDVGTGDIYPDVGITGTPVIDPATNTLYVVAASKTTSGTVQFFSRLHALSLLDGSEKLNGPTAIQATVPGTGDGGTTVSFSPLLNNQRPGLSLAVTPNGATQASVFIAYASHGDNGPYHGWILSYDAADVSKQTGAWCATPDGHLGGIWMPGSGISSDDQGNIFASDGNGTFDGDTGGMDFGDSAFSLSLTGSTLAPNSAFTPSEQSTLNSADLDMGTSGVMLLPQQSGLTPNLAVAADKTGIIYLMNRDKLGGYLLTSEASLQKFSIGFWQLDSFAFFNNLLFVGGKGGPLAAYTFDPQMERFATSPSMHSTNTFGCAQCASGGTTPAISANGTTNAIVWALDRSGREKRPAILHAYDASNLTTELYNSAQAANGRDAGVVAIAFNAPVIANGYVFVGGINGVTVYGELSNQTTVSLQASPTSVAPGAATTLTLIATGATGVTLAGSDGTSYTLPPTGGIQSVSPAATTTYTATAVGPKKTVTASTAVQVGVPTVSISAAPASIAAGSTSVLSISATGATQVTVTGSDGSSSTLSTSGGTQNVTPPMTTTYTATASSATGKATSSVTVTVAPSSTGCLPPGPGILICQPAPNATSTSPLTVLAGARVAGGYITAIRVYSDNLAVITANNPTRSATFQISQALTLASGVHHLVAVAYLSSGTAFSQSEYVTVGSGANVTCYPASPGAMICSPANNSLVTSPVQITAGATAGSGSITAIRVYVDSIAQTLIMNSQKSTSFAISPSLSLSRGSHTLVIIGYQSNGGSVSTSETIRVQ